MNASRKALVLIDDEKAYIDLLAQLLSENLGCPVFTFARPVAALKAIPTMNVGCVVTDFHMPDLNGYELITRAAPLLPGVPFILISGHAVHLDEDRLDWPAAMCSLLAKPFSWRTLASEIAIYAPDLAPAFVKAEAPSNPV